ncbi:MAG: metallophosphoesterase family protein [Planctomycetia bacterium]|nr:metallophosphoesterase family protein [Planctomycetia bacterium]
MENDRRKFLAQTATLGLSSLALGTATAAAEEKAKVPAPSAAIALADPAYAIELRRAPYLVRLRPDGVSIRWRTGRSQGTPPVVRYGTDPDQLTHSLLASELPSAAKDVCDWVATLTSLTPNTMYYYALELASVTLCGGDERHSFRTPPPVGAAETVRFWCIGDSGSNRSRDVTPAMAVQGSGPVMPVVIRNGMKKFNAGKPLTGGILLLGDNAYPTGSDSNYQSAFFQTYGDLLSSTPMWPCTGNHDLTEGVFGHNFAVDKTGLKAEADDAGEHFPFYYSADLGNLHLIVLDPWQNWWVRNTEHNHKPWRRQMEWLEKDLAANKQHWTVLVNHFPIYAAGNIDSDDGLTDLLRAELAPLSDKYGVDLFLTGHDHTYQRSFLIAGNYGTRKTFDREKNVKFPGDGREQPIVKQAGPNSGTVYVIHGAAAGGRPHGAFDHPVMIPMKNKDGKPRNGWVGPGSFLFEVEGPTLRGWAIDEAGKVIDQFSMEKRV